MRKLYEVSSARKALEKKSNKSPRKRKSAEGKFNPFSTALIASAIDAITALRRKAQLPPEAEFVMTYQKCKFGFNLIAKLGHHLQKPTGEKLMEGFFQYLREFTRRNKR